MQLLTPVLTTEVLVVAGSATGSVSTVSILNERKSSLPVRKLTPDLRKRQATRVLLYGPPGSWKTTSIIATALYPLHLISAPGETGWATVPDNVPGLSAYIWEESPSDPVTAQSMRREIEDTIFQTLGGKNGPCRTLALEGLHKMYDIYLNCATDGAHGRGEDFEAQRYSRAHQMFMTMLRRVLSSPVEYLICTSWNAKEADALGSKSAHEYPDLPGKMSRLILGMFSIVIYSDVKQPRVPGQAPKGEWVLKPDSEVWGASCKQDPRLAAKLPARIPQNFKTLYQVVGAAEAELEKENEVSQGVAATN